MRTTNTLFLLTCCFIVLLLSHCGVAYNLLLGVDTTPEWNSASDIEKQARKYNIPQEYNLVMDSVGYYEGIGDRIRQEKFTDKESEEYQKRKEVLKDDTQPVQFRLFTNDGEEIFKLIGCYIEKPIKMDWNINQCLDVFPPSIDIESLNSHYLDLDFFLENSSLLSGEKYSRSDLPSSDYYALIMWNQFMKKPSKKLINIVREKVIDDSRSITLLYINNHNSLLWNLMDSEQKAEMKSYLKSISE